MSHAKTKLKFNPIHVDKATLALIKENNLGLEDLACAICLQMQKFGLCPCALRTLVVQSESLALLKSE